MGNNYSQALNLLRFPLAVIVILIHIWGTSMTVSGQTVSINDYPITKNIYYFVLAFLKSQSVPIYFFISGYVFFFKEKFSNTIYKKKIRNRLYTLLIPYTLWNIFALLFIMLKYSPIMDSVYPHLDHSQLDLSFENLTSILGNYNGKIEFIQFPVQDTWTYPLNFPLWFIRELILVTICTPIIYISICKFKHYSIIFLGIIWFITTLLNLSISQTVTAFFFFSWGSYLSITKMDIIIHFQKFFKTSVLLYILFGISYMYCIYQYPLICPFIKSINIIIGLYFAYNIANWLLRKKWCHCCPIKI